jgi:hypothetical protein
VVLPPVERSMIMSESFPKFFYRILPNGTGWYWEIVDCEKVVFARGLASDRVDARADAFRAARARLATIPEPYPEGTETCHNISSI